MGSDPIYTVQGGALARRKHAGDGARSAPIVEEGVWPAKSAQPPAEKTCCAAGEEPERWRCSGIGRERPYGRAFVDAAQGRAEHMIPGAACSLMIHERVNQADNGEARARRVADRRPATLGVPAEDPAGEAQATHGIRTRGKPHAAGWHLEYVCAARCV